MKILIAPDSFKECLSAEQVATAIHRGMRKSLSAQYQLIPMADGGEGTVQAMTRALRGKMVRCQSHDPLGRSIRAVYGWISATKTAIIETASSSGLHHIPVGNRNPLKTSSFGTGEEIKHALDRKCDRIILGLGGVGTNDGGAGIAKALGFRLLDKNKKNIADGAAGLLQLHKIDGSGAHPRLKNVKVIAASDVKNPLCGVRGSAAVYGPQKGATPTMVREMDRALKHFAKIVRRDLGVSVLNAVGAGAAGAIGAGAMAFLNAKIFSGIEMVIELTNLEKQIRNCDWVITAEGQIDRQTAFGKTAAGIARLAKKYRKPVIALCGNVGAGTEPLRQLGIDAIFSIAPV